MAIIISGSDGIEFPDGSDQTSAFTGNAAAITYGTLDVARLPSSGVNAASITTGILAVGNGGTGLSAVGTSGNVLTSNGTAWTSAPVSAAAFVSGTLMLFQQTSAPTGWTKQTTHDNKALRVVSGSASSGGSVAFTTAFASQGVAGSIANTTAGGSVSISGGSVGSTTLSTSQIPSHAHRQIRANTQGSTNAGQHDLYFGTYYNDWFTSSEANSGYTGFTGSGGSHNHSFSAPSGSFTGTAHNHTFTGTAINLAVSYVDLIIASKD
jgi:hypothetical protein